MAKHLVPVGSFTAGNPQLFLISGPCVIEKESLMMEVAEKLVGISERLGLPLIYKSSFMKDNRSDLSFYIGPGLDEGLRILQKVKETFGLPILTDVHYPEQVEAVAQVVDVIQIPAYLCMQTTLAVTVAKTNKVVNVKHGQFLAPENMGKVVKKFTDSGNSQIILTERGFTFGYNDLVVDPRSFYHMQQTGYPVVFDITHSIRKYGIPSADPRGGSREFMPVLARAAVAAGVDGLFIEAHPCPSEALCDAASQFPIEQVEEFLKPLVDIHHVVSAQRELPIAL